MNEIYIWHHLGMGDHIACNGLVRKYCEEYDKVHLFVKKHNLSNVKRMLRDLKNIEFISGVGDQDQFVHQFLDINKTITLKKITNNDKQPFDREMYKSANVLFSDKWNRFFFERDLNREKEVYTNILGLEEDEEYAFVQTGKGELHLKHGLKEINPGDHMDIGMFDWGLVIERAKEVHCANSSFIHLIDLAYHIKKGFYHSYLRPDSDPVILAKWKIL